jgi:hypothetical protein
MIIINFFYDFKIAFSNFSVYIHNPSTISITRITLSASLNERVTSSRKFGWPGVSIKLNT